MRKRGFPSFSIWMFLDHILDILVDIQELLFFSLSIIKLKLACLGSYKCN